MAQAEKRRQPCPPVDSNYASDRTADTMYELSLFRESLGLSPIPDRPTPYRRPELRQASEMQAGQKYSVGN